MSRARLKDPKQVSAELQSPHDPDSLQHEVQVACHEENAIITHVEVTPSSGATPTLL